MEVSFGREARMLRRGAGGHPVGRALAAWRLPRAGP
jgi:hypothetical protein